MEQKRTDIRIIKSKESIEKAFLELLKEKDFDSITVKELLANARINKATFYKYYQDKYDLAHILCQEFMDEYVILLNRRQNYSSSNELPIVINNIYRFMFEKRELLTSLLKIHTDDIHLYDDMQCVLKNIYIMMNHNLLKKHGKDLELCAHIFSSTILSLLEYMYNNNELLEYEHIISCLNLIFKSNLIIN
ncbi:TetR family transcriptional regulator [Lachnotalea glycerini]|uniref:TetR family transcriptional regulator n=1 Tax=Lachnotalea glycerini TaxID=1763509 RepID=A0A255IEU2_9FIRM|nr:TetR family transcriptional regulator [Lachnotalea glycerini]PXV95707.1 TetR family transcriptional regulator [Lachnotalea glycerini]RDY33223.1 TetR/AcrR family transcriptional regulator [Lachnotalea glycerini]